ncbi:putative signal peptidase [Hypomontagnella submonticulosa]|nr:putative signal peptidase [Hypomontagnella submonticulosa]
MRSMFSASLPFLLIAAHSCMVWKLVGLMFNTAYPAMVVLSESMAPAFQRGDVIVISNWAHRVEAGDIPVLWFEGHPLPMVHRAVEVLHDGKGKQLVMTKGDNNDHTDVALYPPGQTYVYRDQIIGLVRAYVPYVGWLSILSSEIPWLKQVIILGLLIVMLLQTIRKGDSHVGDSQHLRQLTILH